MWHVIAEVDIRCTECLHHIPAGSTSLSQMPVDMPQNLQRRKFENFCISCVKCALKTKQPCYVRRLNHWYAHKERCRGLVACAYCAQDIPSGTRVVVQEFYDWPEFELESDAKGNGREDVNSYLSGGAAGAAAGNVAGVAKPGSAGWDSLSHVMRKKFQTAGLGGARGVRTEAMAQRLYESLPKGVRNLGEEAVKEFMNGKHASHIKSVANAPGRAKWPSNVVWEKAGKNIARGSRNMKASEISDAKSAARSSAINVGLKSTLRSIARGGAIASAIEAPIAGLENILHWRRGRKTSGKAARDSIKSTAVAGVIGVATTGGFVVARAIGLTGVSMGTAGTPLMVASAGFLQ